MIRYTAGFLFAIVAFGFIFLYTQINMKRKIQPVEISIPSGTTISEIGKILEKNRVIKNKFIFILYSKVKGGFPKSGYYRFEGNLSIKDVWEKLYRGKERLFRFTIIPGEDLIDIGEKLENKGFIQKERFYRYVFNKENVRRFGLKGDSFEGYFPPETYHFRKNAEVEEIIKSFLSIFKKRYRPVLKNVNGLSDYEVMIIASLVEKETAVPEEKPIIAGIIIKRLKKGMKLQIDPTVIYALKLQGKWKGKLEKKDMEVDSPYNTYLNSGLPPTPISSFSLQTLKSVINYKETDFLYFFSKDGKRHIFSRSYKEHLKNIKK
ncbi:endolytic transglycosylase MltG [Persephonella sp.]|uniref:endolytic transglycosylase MltG n=1 Tax=Persephonella sp. TaxID=2060922 RepID=UPI0025E2E97E|nr:endolytic transglycosylase MltG [Persephonella sp.]